MGHEEHDQEAEGIPVNELDYRYGGQWFDDMGALAMAFTDAPVMGVSLARSGVSRDQANDMAKNLLNSGITPYDDDSIPEVPDVDMGEVSGGQL